MNTKEVVVETDEGRLDRYTANPKKKESLHWRAWNGSLEVYLYFERDRTISTWFGFSSKVISVKDSKCLAEYNKTAWKRVRKESEYEENA